MANAVKVIRSFYRKAVPQAEVKRFWNLRSPKNSEKKIVAFSKLARSRRCAGPTPGAATPGASIVRRMAHDLHAVVRLLQECAEEPTAAIFDGRTMQSSPESGG